jgi:cytoskeletal protein RodZ
MAEQLKRLPLGRYLQTLRVKKGLDLDEVSQRTHISKQNLIRIEEDNFGRLPALVYVKGFLRAYAEILELNPNRVLQYYAEDLMVRQAPDDVYGLSGRFGFWPRFIFAIFLLIAVISLTFYSATFWDHNPQRQPVMITKMENRDADHKKTGTFREIEAKDTKDAIITEIESPGVNKHKIEVITIEPTQFKVIIDGQLPRTYQLNPKDRLELEALSYFNLLLDNAKGVKLYFNEKPISLSGKAGQNVTIQLP